MLIINGIFYAYFLLVEVVQWHQLGSRVYWADWLNCVQVRMRCSAGRMVVCCCALL